MTVSPDSGSHTLRIVIVDPLAPSRAALRDALAVEGGLSVVGAAGNGAEAVGMVRARCPHVMLVDLARPRVGGLETLRQLTDSGTGVPTIILTDSLADKEVVAALVLGARGILPKNVLPSARYACVRAVAEGDYWVGRERVCDVVDAWHHVHAEQRPDTAGAATLLGLTSGLRSSSVAPLRLS